MWNSWIDNLNDLYNKSTKTNIYSYSCQGCFYGAPLVPSSVDNNDESDAGSLHTAKKGVVSIRHSGTHGFCGALSAEQFHCLRVTPGSLCKHPAQQEGITGSDFPDKGTSFLSSSEPGSLHKTEIFHVSNPLKGSVSHWQMYETPNEHKDSRQSGTTCRSVGRGPRGWALPSFHSQDWHSRSYQHLSLGVSPRGVQK